MRELYHIFHADEYIGDLIHDTEMNSYEFVHKTKSHASEMWDTITNADKGPERFKETILESRVINKNRLDCREILKRLGLLEYDQWEIMKRINFTSDDMFWGSKEMKPEWFWTNHPLASYHPDYTNKTGRPMYSQVVPVDETTIY